MIPVINGSGLNPIDISPDLFGNFTTASDHEFWQVSNLMFCD